MSTSSTITITNTPTTYNDTSDIGIIHTSDAHTITNKMFPPYPTVEYEEEIKKLKQEIKYLKDLIAEHILVGHGDD